MFPTDSDGHCITPSCTLVLSRNSELVGNKVMTHTSHVLKCIEGGRHSPIQVSFCAHHPRFPPSSLHAISFPFSMHTRCLHDAMSKQASKPVCNFHEEGKKLRGFGAARLLSGPSFPRFQNVGADLVERLGFSLTWAPGCTCTEEHP